MYLLPSIYLVFSFYTKDTVGESKLINYLQPNDVGLRPFYDDIFYNKNSSWEEHLCTRPCRTNDKRICYYRFVIELYTTMTEACENCTTNSSQCFNRACVTADGYERQILTINRQMPGPSIQVCVGDTVVIDVKNGMPGHSTTLHWHGIKQEDDKFMDGVPMVTQCPINENEIFRYTYIVSDSGLQFYHSHDGLQKVDGVVGAFIVRVPPSEDPNCGEYDYDLPSHVIVVQDWHHIDADELFPGFRYRSPEQMPKTYLIQGRGVFYLNNGSKVADTPIATFNVTHGFRYKFHIIAGTCFECQYVFTIEGHDMVIIGSDSRPTKPYRVNSLTMSPGERFSIVVNCNKSVDAYWIQVRAMGFCRNTEAYQIAILSYNGSNGIPSSTEPTYNVTSVNDPGLTMNPINSKCTEAEEKKDGPCCGDLRSTWDTPKRVLADKPDKRIIWAFGFYLFTPEELFFEECHYPRFLKSPGPYVGATINGIVNEFPPCPLLSQYEDVPKNMLCPADGFPSDTWNTVHRQCLHIMSVPSHSVIEIVIIDAGSYQKEGMSHSVHLHGYDMYIMKQGLYTECDTFNETLTKLLEDLDCEDMKDVPDNVATKDTIPLSSGGYTVARIISNNTGYWFFHCHFAYHLESGMHSILKVGNHSEMPSPPENFPRCGDYLPIPSYC